MDTSALEKAIGHTFTNRSYLERALRTNGYVNEWNQSHRDMAPLQGQEAYCILGDAVLKLILVHQYIFGECESDAGEISEGKAVLESRRNLAAIARGFGVGEHLMLGRGEEYNQNLRDNRDTLAETMEAIIGALYHELGFPETQRTVMLWENFDSLFAGEGAAELPGSDCRQE